MTNSRIEISFQLTQQVYRWLIFKICSACLIFAGCSNEIQVTKAIDKQCANGEFATENPEKCSTSAATMTRPPVISFDGSITTAAFVGEIITIAPTLLELNGVDITDCSAEPVLPVGLNISSSTCIISGTPLRVSYSTHEVTAKTAAGTSAPAAINIRIEASAPILNYSQSSGTTGTFGEAFSVNPSTLSENGAEIIACSIKPETITLPGWAAVNPNTCVISGTPDATLSSTTYTLIATNSAGQSADATVELSVVAAVPTLSYAESTGTTGTFGEAFSVNPSTLSENGAEIIACSIKPETITLPGWAAVNPNTCVISGTPDATLSSTTYTLIATNSAGQSADATVELSVVAAVPTLSYAESTGTTGTFGEAFSVNPSTLSENGAEIIACSIKPETITLPGWAAVNPTTCVISGTPDATLSSTTYTLIATNAAGQSADATVELSVVAAVPTLSYAESTGTTGTFGEAFSVNPSTLSENGAEIIACSIKPETITLPGWAAVNPNTCVISGTPDATLSSTTYTLIATNSAGQSADATVELSVNNKLTPIAADAFPDTSNYPTVTWTPRVKFSSAVPDTVSLYSDLFETSIKSPTATNTGFNTFSLDSVFSLGQINSIFAKSPLTQTYVSFGSYQTKLPPSFSVPGVSGTVNIMIKDSVSSECVPDPGCIIIGGQFEYVGTRQTKNIARIKPDGSIESFGSGLNSSVYSLAVDTLGQVYAGGWFTSAGGVDASRIAKWNGSTWSPLGTGMNNLVSTLSTDTSGNLYAGGWFTTAGGVTINRIAKWDGLNWSPLGSGTNNIVNSISFDSAGNLYAGGMFTSAGGVSANRVAKWNGTTWSALGSGANGTVSVVTNDSSGNLYAGGQFSTAGGSTAKFIAKWNGTAWSALGTGMDHYVTSIVFDGSDNPHAAGVFSSAGGTPAKYIAKWNGTSWSAVGDGINSTIMTVVYDSSGNLYAGGGFTSAGDVAAHRIAKWDGSKWKAIQSGMSENINSLITDPAGNLYVAGSFANIDGLSANGIAKWNGSNWSALGAGLNAHPYAMAIDASGNLYAGGYFTEAGGISVNSIAKWDGSVWSALGSGVSHSGYHRPVYAVAVDSTGNVYVGGEFSSAGGVTASNIAKWDGSSWSPLGAGVDSRVNAIVVDASGNVYAGGQFYSAGGVTVNNVAKWDGSSWSALGEGLYGSVSTIAIDSEGKLYAGGSLYNFNNIAKWDGTAWSNLGSGIDGFMGVSAIALDNSGNLYAGGYFYAADGVTANNIAKWDGSTWGTLGTGTNERVSALALDSSGNLYVGGWFQSAGDLLRPSVARWIDQFSSWF